MSSGGWVKIKPKQTDKSRGIVLLRPGIPRSVARLLMPGAYREAGDALAVVSVALALPLRGLINLDIVYKGQVLKICYDHSIGHTKQPTNRPTNSRINRPIHCINRRINRPSNRLLR